ncbi:hypothetical protein NKH82_32655 [Mesorhizobium sp. M0915]|uniref:hypothetical protein n=1 Tax=Mesorhizobium sp. M0915 TaxID=2957027 RepID=UPI00333CA13C
MAAPFVYDGAINGNVSCRASTWSSTGRVFAMPNISVKIWHATAGDYATAAGRAAFISNHAALCGSHFSSLRILTQVLAPR